MASILSADENKRTMQNMSFHLQRWEIVGTQAFH